MQIQPREICVSIDHVKHACPLLSTYVIINSYNSLRIVVMVVSTVANMFLSLFQAVLLEVK